MLALGKIFKWLIGIIAFILIVFVSMFQVERAVIGRATLLESRFKKTLYINDYDEIIKKEYVREIKMSAFYVYIIFWNGTDDKLFNSWMNTPYYKRTIGDEFIGVFSASETANQPLKGRM